DVRIVELEALVQPLARKIQFRAVQVHEALRIDQDLYAAILENRIIRLDLIGKLDDIGHTGTPRGADPETQADALASVAEELLDPVSGCFCKRNGHGLIPLDDSV